MSEAAEQPGRAPILTPGWILALGLGLAAAIQATSFAGAWYLDADDWFILRMGREVVQNPGLEPFTRFWTEEPTWRPMLTARAGLEELLFGGAVVPRLTVTLALHVLSALLLFLTLRAWLGRPVAAAWAAVLFSVHPMHGETLVWFHSGFEGVTVTVPILLTLWLFASRRSLLLGLLAFQLALLTRENALCVPLLLSAAAATRAKPGQRWDRVVIEAAPYWALLIANAAARIGWVWMDANRVPGGSFHLAENPIAALVTTIGHPWLPIHPGLDGRLVWWLVFAAIPFGLAFVQRGMDTRELKTALAGFLLAATAFLPQFHDAERFLHAWPGGYEQRWYYFHLPLAFLMIWPAYVLIGRDRRRTGWGTASVCALCALFLCAQGFNARWWNQRAAQAQEVTSVIGGALLKYPPGVGIVVTEGRDASELADQVVLNLSVIWPKSGKRGVRAFHLRTEEGRTRLEEARPSRLGQLEWNPVHALPPYVVWFVVDPEPLTMTPIPPGKLTLPEGAVLPACCKSTAPALDELKRSDGIGDSAPANKPITQ